MWSAPTWVNNGEKHLLQDPNEALLGDVMIDSKLERKEIQEQSREKIFLASHHGGRQGGELYYWCLCCRQQVSLWASFSSEVFVESSEELQEQDFSWNSRYNTQPAVYNWPSAVCCDLCHYLYLPSRYCLPILLFPWPISKSAWRRFVRWCNPILSLHPNSRGGWVM